MSKGSVKDVNYFAAAGQDASAAQIDNVLHDVEMIMERLKGDKLTIIAGKLDGKNEAEDVRKVFEGVVTGGDVKASEMKFSGSKLMEFEMHVLLENLFQFASGIEILISLTH